MPPRRRFSIPLPDGRTLLLGERTLIIRPHVLPVNDRAIDNVSPESLQRQMRGFRPHAVLSLGVRSSETDYGVEHHADDGGMEFSMRPRNVDGRAPRVSMADNFSLERAFTVPASTTRR